MRILVFDLWSDYAHFRIPYTISSPLTFPVPPKTTLYGIIAAFLGYDKSYYLNYFQDEKWKFALSVKSKISKIYIAENLINTKVVKLFSRMPKGKSCRTQINFEFLKSPKYRVYVFSNSEDFNTLIKLVKEHKSTYTITLGLSECIANFEYIGVFNGEIIKENKNIIDICSIIPVDILKNTEINLLQENKMYLKVHLPTEMKPNRELIEMRYFILEANGNTIELNLNSYVYIREIEENVIFF